jgi:hypothetical protein
MSKRSERYKLHEEIYISVVIRANLGTHFFVQCLINLIRKPPRMEKVLNIDLRSASISDKGIGMLKCVEMCRCASPMASRTCLISPQRQSTCHRFRMGACEWLRGSLRAVPKLRS